MNKDLPREKLIKYGADSLYDFELLAIMIGSGTKEKSVFELANDLINEYGLKRLFSMSFTELSKIKGIKHAKATKLMACFEIAKRCITISNENIQFSSASIVYDFIKPYYLFLKNEVISVIFVDSKCRLINKLSFDNYEPAHATLPIKKIIGEAINNNAYGVFLIHNHPSGDVRPSKSDISTTNILYNTLTDIDIILMDHIIVSDTKYFSFLEHKILK